jgi:catechol 2,3-dioxygenase-like lactoylglutathione lyase family enzyme
METFAVLKLQEFEQGKISRRRLIETLVAATTTSTAAGAAQAAQQPAVKVSNVNHVSYTCPNYRQAADWYSKVFNLEQVNDDGHKSICRSENRVRSRWASWRMMSGRLSSSPARATSMAQSDNRNPAAKGDLRDRPYGLHGCRFRPRTRQGRSDRDGRAEGARRRDVQPAHGRPVRLRRADQWSCEQRAERRCVDGF